MSHPSFLSGQYNAFCDVCGQEYKSGQLLKRWDGLIVCEYDFEQRHPQDLIRVRSETPGVPWSRPGGEDVFLVFSSAFGQSTINHEEINGFIING